MYAMARNMISTETRARVSGSRCRDILSSTTERNFGYVPQQIFLSDKSVRHNTAFGIPENKVDG